jgi:hypothetical protein
MTQRGSSWGSYQATITPDPGTTGLSLFLYADAVRTTATGATITEYRDLAVRPSPPLAVSVIPVARSSAPDAQVRRTSQSSFALSVSRSARPFVLSIPESAADGWRLRGVPEDRVAGRVIVHGYAQGWLIEPGPAFEATATFDPDGLLVDGARGVSAAAALSAGFVAMMRRRRRRGERGGPEAAEDSETGSELDPTSAAAPTPWGPSWW